MSAEQKETPPSAPTEQEINSRIEVARKEEKTKLYSELHALQQQVQALDLTAQELAALKQQLAEAQTQLTSLSKAKTAQGEVDTLALVRQVAEDTRRIVQAEKDQEVSLLRSRLDEVERTNLQQRLAASRATIIAGYKGRIIEALVLGSTGDELRASAEVAAKQYEDIVASNMQPGAPVAPVTPSTPPPVNPRAASGNGNPPPSGLEAFKRTQSPAQFGTKRQEVLNSLKERYG